MALKKMLHRLTTPVTELDAERLREFCESRPDVIRIADASARQDVTVVGEISSLRIVPRAGSPTLEATINDGSGNMVVMWTGRRRIAGVAAGRRMVVSGRGSPTGPGGRLMILNPRYELL